MSQYLQSGDVNEVIKHVVQELKLPPSESYGLIFEEPKAFLTPNNLSRISHGFMLTVTAAPIGGNFPSLSVVLTANTSYSPTIRLLVLEEVPAQSLIRHLEKSDERVALAALSLMNALHEKSDAPAREQIIKHFASMPFRTAISGSVLREGRGRNAALLCQLVPLQRLLINESTKFLGMPATETEVDALLAREVVRASASSEEQLKAWADQLLASPLGKLAVDTFANYAEHHPEDLRIVMTSDEPSSAFCSISKNAASLHGRKISPIYQHLAEIAGI
ncbi:hypothetical protein ANCCAN_24593 [Ancylostoma caninum]|uniref:ELMO armadillo-like helical domain-containing protein n=1 Tax=Ancylostoma caninum TaxID=29170 RepID=A0A368FBT9_ANCCA|nr:hypothetical protein ANCCAN_24593 [Ancylostoma caninum]